MSFALTTAQFNARTKTVTRRLGWANLKPGEIFMGVEKGQGLKKGEKVKRLHAARCVSNSEVMLRWLDRADVDMEGFPDLTTEQFVEMFCKHNHCEPTQIVNRIEFEHL